MRQIANLPDERQAQRFVDFLLTQEISALHEQDGNDWSIWVREEDLVDRALEHFEQFVRNPHEAQYEKAERHAESLRRQEEARREKARKNVVEMRQSWSRNAFSGPRPLTILMIVLSVFVAMATGFGNIRQPNAILSSLLFLDPAFLNQDRDPTTDEFDRLTDAEYDSLAFRTTSIRRFEIWRAVTPIFVHYGIAHLFMNMWTLWVIGSPVERKYGTLWYAVFVLVVAVPSTVSGSIAPSFLDGSPLGAGMSGVLFGLFGLIWMKSMFDPGSGFRIPPSMLILIGAFLFIGLTRLDEALLGAPIDNWAHIIGLLCGMAIGAAPTLIKNLRAR